MSLRNLFFAVGVIFHIAANAHAQAVQLFEDDADALVKELNAGAADGKATPELRDVYSGSAAIRVTPFQRFSAQMPGWDYPIVENPKKGQYRYLRFAWKRVDGPGIMIQLHAPDDWNQRLLAGKRSEQTINWGPALRVAEQNPTEWTVVTRDLFKDFGPMRLRGLALTPMDGGGHALFDHFYLGASTADLDRASADAFGKVPLEEPLTTLELGELWQDLASDAAPAGKAMRKLLAGRKESVVYLAAMLRTKRDAVDAAKVARLIAQLGADDFATREAAGRELNRFGTAINSHLRDALGKTKSAEHRVRLEELLKECCGVDGSLDNGQLRIVRAVRILEWTGSAESLQALEQLAKAPPDDAVAPDIRAARDRLAKSLKR